MGCLLLISCASEVPNPDVQKARLTFVRRAFNRIEAVQEVEWQLYQMGDTLYHVYWRVEGDSLQLDRPFMQLAYVPEGKQLWLDTIQTSNALKLVHTTPEMGYELLEYEFPNPTVDASGGFVFVPAWGLLLSRSYDWGITMSLEIHTHPARTALVSHFGQQLIYNDTSLYLNRQLIPVAPPPSEDTMGE